VTTKNAILMIVKQNSGIDYNSLLNKFASSYTNANSARAALSRSLKDLTAFGFLARKGNRFYLLEKGESEIYSEIKNKLVIALNDSMKQKNPHNDADLIVSKLQVLIERAKQDRDLLKTSRGSLDFSISDLERVHGGLEKSVKHQEYVSKVFSEQIGMLKELQFNDSFARQFDKDCASDLGKIFSRGDDKEFTVECNDVNALGFLSQSLKAKARNNTFSIKKKSFPKLARLVLSDSGKLSEALITVFSSNLKAQFYRSRVFLSGPYSLLADWKNLEQK